MKQANTLALSIIFFALAGMLVFLSSFNLQTLSDEQASGAYAITLLAIVLLLVVGTKLIKSSYLDSVTFLHPPILLTSWVIIGLGLPGLYGFFYPEYLSSIGHAIGINYVYATMGLVLVLVGLLSLWVGYGLGLVGMKQKPGSSPIPSQTILIQFYAITVIIRLMRILLTGVAYGADTDNVGFLLTVFNQTFAHIESGKNLVLAVFIFQIVKSNWPKASLLIMILIELIFAFTSGFMKPVFWLCVIISMSAYYAKINLRTYFFIVPIFVIVGILIIPVAQTLRKDISSNNFDTRSPVAVTQASWNAYQNSWGIGIDVGWELLNENIFGRNVGTVHIVGMIMAITPSQVPYQGIDKLFLAPIHIIPRFIWYEKPTLSQGVWFSVNYLNAPYDTNTSTTPTMFGEGYMISGWVGTILGLFGLGILLAFLFRFSFNRGLIPVYITLAPSFMNFEALNTIMIVSLLQSLFFMTILYWLLVQLSYTSHNTKTTIINTSTDTKIQVDR